jgi:hypothetical protein
MATVTNKRKVLIFEENVKLIGEIDKEKEKADVCVNSKIKKIGTAETKLLVRSWSGRPAGRPDHEHSTTVTTIRR